MRHAARRMRLLPRAVRSRSVTRSAMIAIRRDGHTPEVIFDMPMRAA